LNHPEDLEHRALAKELTLRIGHPGKIGKHGVLWFSVDLGESSPRSGARRKARGCVAGIPDLYFADVSRGTYWIELKRRKGGKVSPAQSERMIALRDAGHQVAVCHGAAEAINQLSAWGLL